VATLATPVFYSETITSLSVTQAGWLPCTVYPWVGVYVLRGGAELTLSSAQLNSSTVVNIPANFSVLEPGVRGNYKNSPEPEDLRFPHCGHGSDEVRINT